MADGDSGTYFGKETDGASIKQTHLDAKSAYMQLVLLYRIKKESYIYDE